MVINSVPSKAELDAGGKRKTHAEFTLNKVLDAVPDDSVVAYLKGNLKWSIVKIVSFSSPFCPYSLHDFATAYFGPFISRRGHEMKQIQFGVNINDWCRLAPLLFLMTKSMDWRFWLWMRMLVHLRALLSFPRKKTEHPEVTA